MGMHDDLCIVDEDHGVFGPLVDESQVFAFEIEPDLVIGAAQRAMRNAHPVAANRAMHMAKKQMTNRGAVRLDDLRKRRFIGETDAIEAADVDIERRMVHEQENRLPVVAAQLPIEPVAAALAIGAGVGPRLDRVKHQENTGRRFHRVLHEAVVVHRCFGKVRQETLAMIVIADQQMKGQAAAFQFTLQNPVGLGVAGIRQIAGDHAKFRIGVKPVDIVENRSQPRFGIQILQTPASRNQVRIGNLQKFHAAQYRIYR